jgi:hypothetical protein
MHGVLALILVVVPVVLVVHVLGVSTAIAGVASELVAGLMVLPVGVVASPHVASRLLARVGARILGGIGVRLVVSIVGVLELVWLHLFLTCKVSGCVGDWRV